MSVLTVVRDNNLFVSIRVYSWLNARVACTAAARAGRMQFSNHNLNKSRSGKVERSVNLF